MGAGLGALVAAPLAPRLRRRIAEERIIGGALFLVMAGGVSRRMVGLLLLHSYDPHKLRPPLWAAAIRRNWFPSIPKDLAINGCRI